MIGLGHPRPGSWNLFQCDGLKVCEIFKTISRFRGSTNEFKRVMETNLYPSRHWREGSLRQRPNGTGGAPFSWGIDVKQHGAIGTPSDSPAVARASQSSLEYLPSSGLVRARSVE
ncbi:hypothetical protein GCM10022381_02190 [Leifsonia kafniensis]|uniref:Uncharacterized protein n=1 Tax=Leifsonia kafniensis TaxID=475957 RepID=A0ABP7K0L7_9MICO